MLPNEMHAISSFALDGPGLAKKVSIGSAQIQIIKHPASYNANRPFYDAIQNALDFKRPALKTGAARPLLFFGNFFLEEELRRAFFKSGADPVLFSYNNAGAAIESELSRVIQINRPDFILSVNMKGFDGQGMVSACAARFGIPVVVWFVDDPHPIVVPLRDSATSDMIAFSWERSYLPWLQTRGFHTCAYLPLAGDPSLFPAGESRHAHDLAFVGSSMGRATLAGIAARFLWSPSLEPIATRAADRLLTSPSASVMPAIREACRETGKTIPFTDDMNLTWLCAYVIHTASMIRRREIVGACVPMGIHLFGDHEGWRDLAGPSAITHNAVDYRRELAAVYRSAAVNINVTSCQMRTAVNQRVFDVPLSNGFVLSDNQHDLSELFRPDEIATYDSKESLVDKIRYFQKHESERSAISHKARTRILAEHTYENRISSIKKIIC
jgi:spore maturation protein CgeB